MGLAEKKINMGGWDYALKKNHCRSGILGLKERLGSETSAAPNSQYSLLGNCHGLSFK